MARAVAVSIGIVIYQLVCLFQRPAGIVWVLKWGLNVKWPPIVVSSDVFLEMSR